MSAERTETHVTAWTSWLNTQTHAQGQIHNRLAQESSVEVIFCFFSWSWTCVKAFTVIYCKRLRKENTPTSLHFSVRASRSTSSVRAATGHLCYAAVTASFIMSLTLVSRNYIVVLFCNTITGSKWNKVLNYIRQTIIKHDFSPYNSLYLANWECSSLPCEWNHQLHHNDSFQSPPGLIEDEIQAESDCTLMLMDRDGAPWELYCLIREAYST